MAAGQYHHHEDGRCTAVLSTVWHNTPPKALGEAFWLLPAQTARAASCSPWRPRTDTVWTAWEGEPGCRSGRCSGGSQTPEVTGRLTVWAWWPPPSSWPPAVCSPWLPLWRWPLGCPARPISPEILAPALPWSDVALVTRVLFYNELRNNRHSTQSS